MADCEILFNCFDCTANTTCVWCTSMNACKSGSIFGVSDPTLRQSCKKFQFGQCNWDGGLVLGIAGAGIFIIILVLALWCMIAKNKRRKRKLLNLYTQFKREDLKEENKALVTPKTDKRREEMEKKYGIKRKQHS